MHINVHTFCKRNPTISCKRGYGNSCYLETMIGKQLSSLRLVHTLRFAQRFVSAVQDVADKTLRLDRKAARF